MIKGIWKDYFTFSKKERNAVFILLVILAATIVVPYFVPEKKLRITIDEDLQQQLDKYLAQHPRDTQAANVVSDSVPANSKSYELFRFDPNTLDENGFRKLGLGDKVIHTLMNYRNKGGYFKTPDDIRKVYGLTKSDADRLMPYIKIASSENKQTAYEENKPTTYKEDKQPGENSHEQHNSYKKININTASADEWKALPGIGEVLSNRIIKFRNMLGGFKSIEDVRKTYGLSDSTFQLIKPHLVLKDSAQ